eukprot:COSAG02_NODE_955_length_15680_cov_31.906681_2_plen_39_part_00
MLAWLTFAFGSVRLGHLVRQVEQLRDMSDAAGVSFTPL